MYALDKLAGIRMRVFGSQTERKDRLLLLLGPKIGFLCGSFAPISPHRHWARARTNLESDRH